MRRILASIAVAVGLAIGGIGMAQPAAAYNDAPAYHICRYWQPTWVTYSAVNFTWYGHPSVRCVWRFLAGGAHWECWGIYDRVTGYATVVDCYKLS